MPYKVISPYTQRYSNESVHCSFKSLIPLLKITIHLDTQFPSDQTLNARTCLPSAVPVLAAWSRLSDGRQLKSPLMRGFLCWVQIWGGNENRSKYVERPVCHLINAFLKSWLKIGTAASLLLFSHSETLIRFLFPFNILEKGIKVRTV